MTYRDKPKKEDKSQRYNQGEIGPMATSTLALEVNSRPTRTTRKKKESKLKAQKLRAFNVSHLEMFILSTGIRSPECKWYGWSTWRFFAWFWKMCIFIKERVRGKWERMTMKRGDLGFINKIIAGKMRNGHFLWFKSWRDSESGTVGVDEVRVGVGVGVGAGAGAAAPHSSPPLIISLPFPPSTCFIFNYSSINFFFIFFLFLMLIGKIFLFSLTN